MVRKKNRRIDMKANESYRLQNKQFCKELLSKYPDYKVYWRSGFVYRGAREVELDRNGQFKRHYPYNDVISFEEKIENELNWSAATDVIVLHHKKALHFNGFSENDLY